MTQPIIEIAGLGKKYRIGADREKYISLRDQLAKAAHGFVRRFALQHHHLPRTEDFWALKDVSFSVQEGDAVGIIGRNGAGKSTLLKILSMITPPTEGRITCRGRIASLLEVGTGFHPELTGRENIFLNGAILGMTRVEIKRKFDEIVHFAEIGRFLDTPVKRYSSGMYVRLAFAVAAHLDPEILVVDEVLAVGDAQFQKKCLGKMGDAAKNGKTVLFVSHNMDAMKKLCNKGVLLDKGGVSFFGSTADAVLKHTSSEMIVGCGEVTFMMNSADKPSKAKLTRVQLQKADQALCASFFMFDCLNVRIDAVFYESFESIRLSFIVRSELHGNIYHCVASDAGFNPGVSSGKQSFVASFPRLALYPGKYCIDDVWLAAGNTTLDNVRGDLVSFVVIEGGPEINRPLNAQCAVVHEIPKWAVAPC